MVRKVDWFRKSSKKCHSKKAEHVDMYEEDLTATRKKSKQTEEPCGLPHAIGGVRWFGWHGACPSLGATAARAPRQSCGAKAFVLPPRSVCRFELQEKLLGPQQDNIE